ncbi:ABC transporter permease [Pseudoalteromonas sp. BDTF-M6]|uniref:ABC transporter permease n=1 Tax=Pseudoalteromonas sp. BDTF-M6 TaxID=2796132 RepID=UPI001BAE71BA|nr:ABC transporter permease [Pseudoalteromonas sp. BDTF-M6]MBS3797419.1 ABC transporter permease [Pseudoalteromonas sp. BDTF-M6]
MILLKLASKSLLNRRASVLLSLLTIAISVMLLLTIERVRMQAKESFAATVSGTDLIVGARTGDIQLLLASVFRIGHMNNGVSWQSYQDISSKKGIKWVLPLSLGDTHKGYAVLGTSGDYFHYFQFGKKQHLSFSAGGPFAQANEVVLGAEVAKRLGYGLGDKIVVAHGMGKTSFHHHDDKPLVVVGILAATGTPVDKTLHVPLIAIDQLHGAEAVQVEHHEHSDHEQHHQEADDLIGEPKQISAFLLGFDSPLYTLQVRRNINNYQAEPLMAIMPGVTLRELWGMLAMVEKLLLLFSVVVLVVSLLGMLTTLLANLSQRRRELAILRSVGAKPWHIFSLMSMESLLISLLGTTFGVALCYLLLALAQPQLQAQAGINIGLQGISRYELMLIAVIMAAAWIVGLIPAVRAYFYSLHDGMSVKT